MKVRLLDGKWHLEAEIPTEKISTLKEKRKVSPSLTAGGGGTAFVSNLWKQTQTFISKSESKDSIKRVSLQ